MGRIDDCLAEYKDWCKKLGIVTVSDVNKIINDGRENWLINVSEIWHEQKISEISKKIKDDIDKKKIILISGPSSSGKTSFAVKLQLHLKVLGINAVSISLDNYYIKNEDMPLNDEGKPDFEAFESIDYMRFNQNVEDLIAGKETTIPIYDFTSSSKIENGRRLRLEPNEVIIVEGIHGLNEKLTYNISDENKFRIYCSALTALSMDDGTRIKSRTTRLIRRLIRDYYFRNSDYKYTFELWPNVEAGAKKNIFPYVDHADVIFNSSLLYELCVYKRHLNEVFKDASEDDPNYEMISHLMSIVNSFCSIEPHITPGASLVREFVGNSTLDI
ncbi:MAG: nucleoside kinase [Clostridia bacterium]|nr:nucleoside kinase [Clostridia bacterium]